MIFLYVVQHVKETKSYKNSYSRSNYVFSVMTQMLFVLNYKETILIFYFFHRDHKEGSWYWNPLKGCVIYLQSQSKWCELHLPLCGESTINDILWNIDLTFGGILWKCGVQGLAKDYYTFSEPTTLLFFLFSLLFLQTDFCPQTFILFVLQENFYWLCIIPTTKSSFSVSLILGTMFQMLILGPYPAAEGPWNQI